jgi:hypothetical protein
MRQTMRLAVVLTLLLGTAAVGPTSAACPPTNAWPPFVEIADDARRVVIGTVTAVDAGSATHLRVEEILRGNSRRILDLAVLRARLIDEDVACPFDGLVPAQVGDRLAIALSGHTDDWPRRQDGVALLDADEQHPNSAGLERFTTPQVRLLLGHESNGSTIAVPDRSKPPVDLLEALRRALFGDLFDIVDAFGLEANED